VLTLSEVAACEGYYLDVETGDILRNVGPAPNACSAAGSFQDVALDALPDVPRFEQIGDDVTLPLETVVQRAAERLGRTPSGRIVNRQTAIQPDGILVTEESLIR
jgi:hypothetical protein